MLVTLSGIITAPPEPMYLVRTPFLLILKSLLFIVWTSW